MPSGVQTNTSVKAQPKAIAHGLSNTSSPAQLENKGEWTDERPEASDQRQLQADVALHKAPNPLAQLTNAETETVTNAAPVQRVVDVGGERDPLTLWANVKDLVEKVYRRKKTLLAWCEDAGVQPFGTYQELADALDFANQSKASMGRTRPGWAPGISKFYDKTWGGKRHRRHIIMSSLMRDAVYAVTDANSADPDRLIAIYNEIVSAAGFTPGGNLGQAEAALVYVLHNNPANLVLDNGPENSAIGGLAHNVDGYLQKDDGALAVDFATYQTDQAAFLRSLAHGFEPGLQAKIMGTIIDHFPRPAIFEEFRDFLEMIYDNNAFDLMTKQDMPDYTPELTDLHGRFLAAAAKGDADMLYGTGMTYVAVGNGFSDCPYSSIW